MKKLTQPPFKPDARYSTAQPDGIEYAHPTAHLTEEQKKWPPIGCREQPADTTVPPANPTPPPAAS